jgi:hypothetical protein
MDSLGKRFLAALLREPGDADLAKFEQSFLTDDAKTAAEWIWAYREDYKGWPTPEQLEENTGISLSAEEAPPDYFADLLRKRSLGIDLEKAFRAGITKLDARDPDAAVDIISEAARLFRARTKRSRVISHKDSGFDRIKEYDELKRSDGLLGFPTPWERLNRNIQGWVNGTLNVVTAMQNTGKTWWLCYCANHAYDLGKRVLFISLEMDVRRIQKRLDALRYKIPFRALKSCDMDEDDELAWKERVRLDKSKGGVRDILLADKKLVLTVDDAVNLIADVEPHIVMIDGGYRFRSKGRDKGHWESSAQIVADLQLAAEMTDIPWVVTTQQGDAQETGKAKRGAKKMIAWGVRYAKEWVINPDNVIGLFSNDDMRLLKVLEMHQLKMRDAPGDLVYQDFPIRWDLVKMDFGEFEELEEPEILTREHEVVL